MVISLTNDQVRCLRLRAQRLTPQQPDEAIDAARIVKEVCGIQAQDMPAATLAVRARSVGLVAADIKQALVQDRSTIRTWGPRGTLHLLAADDIGWLLPLLGPVLVAGDQRRREELGLDEDICVRAMRIIRNILANMGPLTRAELFEHLAINGIRLEGQARPHLLFRAAFEGIICFGPDCGTEPTYVLLNDWIDQKHVGHSLSEDVAYVELIHRYLSAYGPATPKDLAAWSGTTMGKIRAAWNHIAGQLLEVECANSQAWVLKSYEAWLDELLVHVPTVRLLPRFDNYLLGYQKRELAVQPQYAKRVNAGGGIIHPTVMVDGQVVGTWKSKRGKNHLEVIVEPFEQLAAETHQGLEAETEDIARFLDVKASLQVLRPS
jgi:Winged helix DNA-binding domain